MTTPSENSADAPNLEDLKRNGANVPEGAVLVENFDYQPSDFEGSGIEINVPLPAIVLQIREGLFKTFSLWQVVSDEDGKYEIQEGEGETMDAAKKACLTKTIDHAKGVFDMMKEYARHRRFTEV